MNFRQHVITILLMALLLLSGCTLGMKDWPRPVDKQDTFSLSLAKGERKDKCLVLSLKVRGAVDKLSHVTIQYEMVGDAPGSGCPGCPFMPREAIRISPGDANYNLNGDVLDLTMCELEAGREYRFRIIGVNALTSLPPVATDVFVATP